MSIKLHVSYSSDEYLEGFRFRVAKYDFENEVYLGEMDIDIPFDKPDQSLINKAKVDVINAEIKDHKAKINVLENQVKDLLSIENKTMEVA